MAEVAYIGTGRARRRAMLAAALLPLLPMRPPSGHQTRDLAGYDQAIQYPNATNIASAIVSAWRDADTGYPRRQCDLIDALVEGDAHARNLFETRQQAVAGKPTTIQAGGPEPDAELAARVLRFALERLPMKEVYEHLLTYNRYGWAAAEMDWGLITFEGRTWIVPTAIAIVKSNRFRIGTESMRVTDPTVRVGELRLYSDITRPQGDALIPGKWLVMLRSGGDVSRAGLGRTAAWNIMGKRMSFRDLLIYSQRYGMPIPIASYKTQGEHADDDAIDTAYEIVENIGRDGGAVVPDTITLELKEPVSGENKVHPGNIAICNRENSKLINGSTLANDSADSGGASYALGEIHDSVRWEAVQYDAERLQSVIELQLFEPFMVWNGYAAAGVARPKHNIQVARDLAPTTRVQVADILVNKLGVKVSIGQLRSDTGFREPTSDDDAAPGAPNPVATTEPIKPLGADA